MKKILFFISFLLIGNALQAQNLVSVSAENKSILLENFTAINCYYCAEADQMASSLQNSLGSDFIWVNIHAGIFANPNTGQPDFRSTAEGELRNLANPQSYPSAMLNRSNLGSIMQASALTIGREDWQEGVDSLQNQTSPVNIAAQAQLDVSTRQLKVIIESYYTAAASGSHHIHAALLLDEMAGPQQGASALFPSNINNEGQYIHHNIFHSFLTGSTGIAVNATSMGSFQADTVFYTLPADFNGLEIDFPNVKVAVWVAEDSIEVLNAAYASKVLTTPNPIATSIEEALWAEDFNQICGNSGDLQMRIKNLGTDSIRSVEVSYDVNNGGTTGNYTHNFSSAIPTGYSANFTIPNLGGLNLATNMIDISVVQINLQPNPNINNVTTTVDAASLYVSDSTNGVFWIQLDAYPEDVSWELLDETAATTVLTGNGSAVTQSATILTDSFVAVDGHCYSLKVTDSYGDGICCAYGQGSYFLKIGSLEIINGGEFDAEDGLKFTWQQGIVATRQLENVMPDWQVFPNPAGDQVQLQLDGTGGENYQLVIYNAIGQQVGPQQLINDNYTSLDVSQLPAGVYLLSLQGEQNVSTKRLVIQR